MSQEIIEIGGICVADMLEHALEARSSINDTNGDE